jgi:hypothetical protein
MFANRRISCSLGKTVNLGNFESLRIDIGMEADISLDKNLDDARNSLFQEVFDELTMRCEGLSKPKLIPKPPTKKL